MSRTRLTKLIGKKCVFEGTVHVARNATNYMILNVKHNGKTVADHVWVGVTDPLDVGSKISFTGTPYTYKDSHDVRKTGIGKVYDVGDAMNDTMKHYVKNCKKNKPGR